MTCVNAYDTITQADGTPLSNHYDYSDTGQPHTITSYCRGTDGTWVAWVQNDFGDGIDAGSYGAYGPVQDKAVWPVLIANVVPVGVGFFPDDGSAPTVYELGIDPAFTWNTLPNYGDADPCSIRFITQPTYDNATRSQLAGWSTSVLDVQVRSDGANVWIVVLANESRKLPLDYLYDSGRYGNTDRCGNPHDSIISTAASEPQDPGGAFFHDTDTGNRWWEHGDDYAGPGQSFRWQPGHIIVFAGDIAGFTRLGEIEATFFNDDTGFGLTSQVEACASPAEPGVVHVLWAEGGGRDPFQANYGQRINYSRWDSTGEILLVDLLHAEQAKPVSGAFPADANFVWTAEIALRNDHGSPVAFVAPWVCDNGPSYVGPVEMWDLSGGTLNRIQILDPALIPTPAEAGTTDAPGAVGALDPGMLGARRSMFVSSLYTDPRLDNQDVYLLCIPYGEIPTIYEGRNSVAFYRIPCDGSDTFSFLDGIRSVGYSIVADNTGLVGGMFASDFVSDPDDVWMPAVNDAGGAVLQLDRQCLRGWNLLPAFPAPDPRTGYETGDWMLGNSPPALLSLDDGDWIYGAGYGPKRPITDLATDIAALKAKICRCCLPCNRTGMHVWEII